MTRITGRRTFLRLSQVLCSASSGSRYAGSAFVEGPGSEAFEMERAGELGRVTYRGVGTEFGI